jgi:hypothetical protein
MSYTTAELDAMGKQTFTTAELDAMARPHLGLLSRLAAGVWNAGPAAIVHAVRTKSNVGLTFRDAEILKQYQLARESGELPPETKGRLITPEERTEALRVYEEMIRRADDAITKQNSKPLLVGGTAGQVLAGNQIPIPPAKGVLEKVADVAGGVGGTIANIGLTRRLMPTAPEPLVWEAATEAAGGTPGTGALQAGIIQGAGRIVGKSAAAEGLGKRVLRRAERSAIEAAGFGTLAAVQDGSPEEIATQALIPLAFTGLGVIKEGNTVRRREILKTRVRAVQKVETNIPPEAVVAAEKVIDSGAYDTWASVQDTSSVGAEAGPTFKPRMRVRGDMAGLAAELEAKRNDLDQQLAEHLEQESPDPTITANLAQQYKEAEGRAVGARAAADGGGLTSLPTEGAASTGAELPPFSTRNVDTAAVREQMDLPPIERRPPETQAQWAAEAPTTAEVDRIAEEVVASPRILTPQEHKGFEVRLNQLSSEYDTLSEQLGKLPAESPEARAKIAARNDLRRYADIITQATDLAGTPWSYSGLARQNLLARLRSDPTNALAMIAKAEDVKGDKLTPMEQTKVEAGVKVAKEKTTALEVKQREAAEKKANQAIRVGCGGKYAHMTKAEKDAELAELVEKAKASPEDTLFFQIAMNLGSRPGIRTVGDVTDRIQQHFDKINRYSLSTAIVNAMTRKARAKTELQLQLAEIRREAKTDVRLRTTIDDVLWHLKNETVPDAERGPRNETADITALRDMLDYYRRELRQSEPAQVARYERLIKILENRIASGDFTMPEPGPMSEVVHDLKAKYKRLQAEFNSKRKIDPNARIRSLTQQITDLDRRIATGHTQKLPRTEAPRESEEIDALMSEKRAKEAELNRMRQERQTLMDLRVKIRGLQRHLQEGTTPQKAPAIGGREPSAAEAKLREAVSLLQERIAQSPPAQKARLQRTLDMLNEQLRTRDFQRPTKIERSLRDPEVERLAYQVYQARQAVNHEIAKLDPWWRHPGKIITQPFREVQTWKSSADMSALLRQGGIAVRTHPIRTLRRLPEAMRAIFDPARAWKINDEIVNGERAWWYHRVGLEFTDYGGVLSAREEAFASHLVERVPGLKHIVRGSNRGFVTLLNMIRADSYDAMERSLRGPGGLSLHEAQALATYVNVMTGRGTLAGLEKYAPTLNGVLWSPRFTLSRIQYRLALPLLTAPTWQVRKVVALEYARYIAGVSVAAWLYQHVFGGRIEKDRRSSDYGKLVVSNTRLDPMSGLSQVSVLIERLGRGEIKQQSGAVVPIAGSNIPYRGDTRLNTSLRFLRSKLGFLPGKLVDIAVGRDFAGEPVSVSKELPRFLFPLAWEEVLQLTEDQGVPKMVAIETLNLLGEGVQVYNPKEFAPTVHRVARRTIRRGQR